MTDYTKVIPLLLDIRENMHSLEHIQAIDLAIRAVEKQIKQKPSYIEEDYGIFECPVCKEVIESSSDLDTWHFCMNCGQALDWTKEAE